MNKKKKRLIKTQWTIELLTTESRFCTRTHIHCASCRMHIDITFSLNFKQRCDWELLAMIEKESDLKRARRHWLVELCLRKSTRANFTIQFFFRYRVRDCLICNLWFSKQISTRVYWLSIFFLLSSSLLFSFRSIVFLFSYFLWIVIRFNAVAAYVSQHIHSECEIEMFGVHNSVWTLQLRALFEYNCYLWTSFTSYTWIQCIHFPCYLYIQFLLMLLLRSLW